MPRERIGTKVDVEKNGINECEQSLRRGPGKDVGRVQRKGMILKMKRTLLS